ncbi:MAG: response regulator transcription factor [Actinomycetota bacterium]
MSVMTPGGRNSSDVDTPKIIIDLEASLPAKPEFTRRQREVLGHVAQGFGNAEIASTLGLSKRTVEKHIERIHMKAGTATRARLVAFAMAFVRLDQDESAKKH